MEKFYSLDPVRMLCALIIAFVIIVPLQVFAGEPTDQVRQSVEELRKIFKNKELNRPEKRQERNKQLREIVDQRFDFEELSKRALGRYWRERTPEERKEFVALFSDMLEDIYLKKIETQESKVKEHVEDKVLYTNEKVSDSYAVVQTRVITKTGQEVPIDYRLLKKSNDWRVYDIYIEGVSLVNNYRTQFNQIIRSSSYEELIKRMKAKQVTDPTEKKK